MTKRDAHRVVERCVVDAVEDSEGRQDLIATLFTLVGTDPAHVEELATALAVLGYAKAASRVHHAVPEIHRLKS